MTANQTKAARPETAPRILLYDLECFPMVGATWGPRWEANLIEVIEEKMICSFSWKWLGETQIRCLALPDFPGYKRKPNSNAALIRELHKIRDKAHIAVGHNIDRFDDKLSNTDSIVNGMGPTSLYKTVDTLKVARTKFAFSSNKLDDLGARLGVGRKVKHPGYEMWKGCKAGDPKHWAHMKLYNMGDVALLERVYLKMLPWMTNHPNLNALVRVPGCPKCGAVNTQMKVNKKYAIAGTMKKVQFSCKDCGGYSTGVSSKAGEWSFK